MKKKETATRGSKAETAGTKEYPPGIDEPLAFDAPGFVDEMHARVNLYEVGRGLLANGDVKIRQRTWEYLLEMKFGRGAPVATEETPRLDWELPKPKDRQ